MKEETKIENLQDVVENDETFQQPEPTEIAEADLLQVAGGRGCCSYSATC